LAVGNEALQTNTGPPKKKQSLIGMELVRLALERAQTAEEAVEVIAGLLEEYGQGGECGYSKSFRYHNGFLIADKSGSVWIMNTIDNDWVARKINPSEQNNLVSPKDNREECEAKGIVSISNVLSAGRWDKWSEGFLKKAVANSWCSGREDFREKFQFREKYAEFLFATFGEGYIRECRTRSLLLPRAGSIEIADITQVLRDHGPNSQEFNPGCGLWGQAVCMHSGWGPIRKSQTTCSMIFHLTKNMDRPHWVTATSAPCTSAFIPVWFDAFPNFGPPPTRYYSAKSLWWLHELVHRNILFDYRNRAPVVVDVLRSLETDFFKKAFHAATANALDRQRVSQFCIDTLFSTYNTAKVSVPLSPLPVGKCDFSYAVAWHQNNKAAQIDIPFQHIYPTPCLLFLRLFIILFLLLLAGYAIASYWL